MLNCIDLAFGIPMEKGYLAKSIYIIWDPNFLSGFFFFAPVNDTKFNFRTFSLRFIEYLWILTPQGWFTKSRDLEKKKLLGSGDGVGYVEWFSLLLIPKCCSLKCVQLRTELAEEVELLFLSWEKLPTANILLLLRICTHQLFASGEVWTS